MNFSSIFAQNLSRMIHNFLYRIKFWWNSLFKYKLSKEEMELYNSILHKDAIGYYEWYKQTKGNDICGHRIKDITKEEMELIDKIHSHFYSNSKDWYVSLPISNAQVYSIMLDNIKDKISYKTK